MKIDLIKNNTYTFKELEGYLNQSYPPPAPIKVYNPEVDQKAIMHCFGENFSTDYLSGDGVLFYDDGEVHSANDRDEFVYLESITW